VTVLLQTSKTHSQTDRSVLNYKMSLTLAIKCSNVRQYIIRSINKKVCYGWLHSMPCVKR